MSNDPVPAAKSYSVTDLLRGKLRDALGAVEFRGEEVIITRQKKPIAKLVPMPPEDDKPLADPMGDVIRRGDAPPITPVSRRPSSR